MNEQLKNARNKLWQIHDLVDEISMLMQGMSDDTKNTLDLLDERNALREWENKLSDHYNDYAQVVLKTH